MMIQMVLTCAHSEDSQALGLELKYLEFSLASSKLCEEVMVQLVATFGQPDDSQALGLEPKCRRAVTD